MCMAMGQTWLALTLDNLCRVLLEGNRVTKMLYRSGQGGAIGREPSGLGQGLSWDMR